MQRVSDEWKSTMRQTIVPESFVEISYKVSDYDSERDASATDNGHWSEASADVLVNLLDKEYSKYAALEHNMWLLDGTHTIFDDSKDIGYISSVLSSEDGSFEMHPVITIRFTQVHTVAIPGITINWGNAFDEWAKEFIVTVYNGEDIVTQRTITDNITPMSVVNMEFASYDKITVEILKWCLPLRRARIEEIVVGIVTIFDKSTLTEYTNTQFVDLMSFDLPKAEVVFSITNVEGEWNPDNPEGVFKYLMERQELKVRYGYKIGNTVEWIKCGTFYMSEWETPQNGITASFTARDLFEFMQEKFKVTSGTFTLKALAVQALEQSNLPLGNDGFVRWILDDCLDSISVKVSSDFDYTCAEVLQLCANAACCVLYQNREGKLIIEKLTDTLTDYLIDGFVSYAKAEYSISKELKSVDVNDGMGTADNSTTGETQTLENPLIQTEAVANAVAVWVRDCLMHRKTLSGEYRADPRLDALDKVSVKNKYAETVIFVTDIKYTYNGAFKGSYEGRAIV